MNFVSFVMAGGTGTRFWPASRKDSPKQLLSIGEHPVMIKDTTNRLLEFQTPDQIFVVTASEHAGAMKEILDEIPPENIIVEPEGRDTAPCAGLSGIITEQRFNRDTVVGLFPADHRIEETSQFQDAVETAVEGASGTEKIITFGIQPDRPATGYGYILPEDSSSNGNDLLEVEQFTEKPNKNTAIDFIEDHSALWNSGMFVWSANTILSEIEKSLPDLHAGLNSIKDHWDSTGSLDDALSKYYSQLPSTSVDYGVIEEAKETWTLPVDFSWNDLGTWESVETLLDRDPQNNAISGNPILHDVDDSVLVNMEGPTIGAVGLDDMVVVSTEDALLVCPKNLSEDVKKLVNKLKSEGRDELL